MIINPIKILAVAQLTCVFVACQNEDNGGVEEKVSAFIEIESAEYPGLEIEPVNWRMEVDNGQFWMASCSDVQETGKFMESEWLHAEYDIVIEVGNGSEIEFQAGTYYTFFDHAGRRGVILYLRDDQRCFLGYPSSLM